MEESDPKKEKTCLPIQKNIQTIQVIIVTGLILSRLLSLVAVLSRLLMFSLLFYCYFVFVVLLFESLNIPNNFTRISIYFLYVVSKQFLFGDLQTLWDRQLPKTDICT